MVEEEVEGATYPVYLVFIAPVAVLYLLLGSSAGLTVDEELPPPDEDEPLYLGFSFPVAVLYLLLGSSAGFVVDDELLLLLLLDGFLYPL